MRIRSSFPSLLAIAGPVALVLLTAAPSRADCGDGVIDPGETCDPPSSCPSSCSDGNPCTTDTMTGTPQTCDVVCASELVTACTNGDGCCPEGCASPTDDDCSVSCGNGAVGEGETCDPPSSCLTSCDDGNACTADLLTGASDRCNAACSHVAIVSCNDGDGCCPAGCTSATDDDCTTACGDGVLAPGETCDPPSSCPSSCDDGLACTRDFLTGSAEACTAACAHAVVTECASGDGCCPAGCTAYDDDDCSSQCDVGGVGPGETCDPSSTCPASCDDGNACTYDQMAGTPGACDVICIHTAVVSCAGGDGCCPSGCTSATDADCSPACGNGVLDPGETCDPPGACPTSCDDAQACTDDVMVGSAANCNVGCSHTLKLACVGGDGCCPPGCSHATDSDCSATCDDLTLDQGETCDPPADCITSCDDADACTIDVLIGSAANCNTTCTHQSVVSCRGGDGCCPPGCNNAADSDCSATCGNGTLDPGETCDPPSTCPTSCDDGDACTYDVQTGSVPECTIACTNTPITACLDGDGCCPAGCNGNQDTDCPPVEEPDAGYVDVAMPDAAEDGAVEASPSTPEQGSKDDSGCGCSTPSTPTTGPGLRWVAMVLAGLAGLRRRLRGSCRAL